jgi:hypothetical protein
MEVLDQFISMGLLSSNSHSSKSLIYRRKKSVKIQSLYPGEYKDMDSEIHSV